MSGTDKIIDTGVNWYDSVFTCGCFDATFEIFLFKICFYIRKSADSESGIAHDEYHLYSRFVFVLPEYFQFGFAEGDSIFVIVCFWYIYRKNNPFLLFRISYSKHTSDAEEKQSVPWKSVSAYSHSVHSADAHI